MGLQPGGQRVAGVVVQDVNDPVALDVDQHSAVAVRPLQGELVNPQDARALHDRFRQREYEGQQGHPADHDVQHPQQPGPGTAGQSQPDRLRHPQ